MRKERIMLSNLIFSPHDWKAMGYQKRHVTIIGLLDHINIFSII